MRSNGKTIPKVYLEVIFKEKCYFIQTNIYALLSSSCVPGFANGSYLGQKDLKGRVSSLPSKQAGIHLCEIDS